MSKKVDILHRFINLYNEAKEEGIASMLHDLIGDKPGKVVKAAKRKAGATFKFKHCVYPGCKKPHKGPRFGFLCESHMSKLKDKAAPKWRDAARGR